MAKENLSVCQRGRISRKIKEGDCLDDAKKKSKSLDERPMMADQIGIPLCIQAPGSKQSASAQICQHLEVAKSRIAHFKVPWPLWR